MKETYAEFIEKARVEYKKIGSITCPAFYGEQVYFNACGFNHLIRKGRVPRKTSEQIRRIHLIPQAVAIISKGMKACVYRKTMMGQSMGHFWTFKKTYHDTKVQVVIRQMNTGRKHFFSVM
jgi:hypothetical protein